jgi:hypothetical protein
MTKRTSEEKPLPTIWRTPPCLLARSRPLFLPPLPRVVGLVPCSFRRRVHKLRRFFLEPLVRRTVVAERVGEPETLLIDSTLLSVMHPRRLVSFSLRASEAQRG